MRAMFPPSGAAEVLPPVVLRAVKAKDLPAGAAAATITHAAGFCTSDITLWLPCSDQAPSGLRLVITT